MERDDDRMEQLWIVEKSTIDKDKIYLKSYCNPNL